MIYTLTSTNNVIPALCRDPVVRRVLAAGLAGMTH